MFCSTLSTIVKDFTFYLYTHIYTCSDNLSQQSISNIELLKGVNQLVTYYNCSHSLAENVRYAHEFGSMSFETVDSSTTMTSKELFEAKLAEAESTSGEVKEDKTSNPKDLFEQKYVII